MKYLNTFYTRMTYYFVHSNGYDVAKAKNKAFYKAALLLGVFLFFIYMMIMNSLNQLFWNFNNTGTNGVLFVAPFVLIAYALFEWKLRPHLKIAEDVAVYDAGKLKACNRFQIKIGILAGAYAAAMFSLVRLSNIYIFDSAI